MALLVLAGCRGLAPEPQPQPEATAAVAQPRESAREAIERANAAVRSGDRAALLDALRVADARAPNQPGVVYFLARTHMAAGSVDSALAALARLAPLGGLGVDQDTTFRELASDPRFVSILERLRENSTALVRSDTAFVIPDPDRLPESIAYDPRGGVFYIGSLARNTIDRIAADGTASPFADLGPRGQVIGIRVDPRRGWLWAAEAGHTADDSSEVHAYDLASGARMLRLRVPRRARNLANDIAVAPSGDVFITDTEAGAVLRWRSGADSLETVVSDRGSFNWPNGIDIARDGRRLYVAHAEGISTVDLATGRRTRLAQPADVSTAGIDGMYACRDYLVAIQMMRGFDQVVRFDLSPDGDRILHQRVLERRHPAYEQPTTGVLVEDTLYYIANSQLRRRQPDGTLRPAAEPRETAILRLPLDGCD